MEMNNDEITTGIVIDSYSHGENQVVTVRDSELEMRHFFYLPKYPDVSFGDTILLSLHSDKYWVHHGNPHLTYRLFPIAFPGTLLLEIIQAQMEDPQ